MKNRKLNILYIAESNIPSNTANSFHVISMCEGFAKDGDNITLVTPDYNNLYPENLNQHIIQHYGLKFMFNIKFIPIKKFARGIFFTINVIKIVMSNKFDLIISRSITPSTILGILRKKIILEIHAPPKGIKQKLLIYILSKLNNLIALVVITNSLKKIIIKSKNLSKIINKIKVVPDAVDIDKFSLNTTNIKSIKSLYNIDSENFCVGYVGHLYSGRGLDLIFAIAKIMTEINFIVVGGDELRVKELKSYSKKEGIENVYFLGFINHSNLPEVYTVFDIVLMPYQNDTRDRGGNITTKWMSPMKMFEYMASRKPIIASDLNVLKEILSEDECLFCDPDNHMDWIKKIQILKANSILRKKLQINAYNKVRNHTWHKRVVTMKGFIFNSLN